MSNIIIHDPLVNEFRSTELTHYNKALGVVVAEPTITGDGLAKALGMSPSYGSKILRVARLTLGIECSKGNHVTRIADLERFRHVARVLAQSSVTPTASAIAETNGSPVSWMEAVHRLVEAASANGVTQLSQRLGGFDITITKR